MPTGKTDQLLAMHQATQWPTLHIQQSMLEGPAIPFYKAEYGEAYYQW